MQWSRKKPIAFCVPLPKKGSIPAEGLTPIEGSEQRPFIRMRAWHENFIMTISTGRAESIRSLSAHLNHLPAISGRIAEAGIYVAVTVDGLLRELHAHAQ